MNWFLKVVKENYANFSGRARRKEYWMYVLFYSILLVVAGIVDGIIIGVTGAPLQILTAVVSLGLLVPTLAVAVRRLHDIGKSGKMIFVCLIPVVGSIWLLILLIKEGIQGENEFGADPKAE